MLRDATVPRSAIHTARTADAYLSTMMATAQIGMAILDRSLRYVHCNAHLALLLGCADRRLVGHRLDEVFDLSDADGRVAVSLGIGSGIGAIFGAPLGGAVLAASGQAGDTTRSLRVVSREHDVAGQLAASQQIDVTVSIGGAFAPQWVRSTPGVWMERADLQLYRAKSEGRNRTCLEPTPVSVVSAEEKGLLFASSIFGEDLS